MKNILLIIVAVVITLGIQNLVFKNSSVSKTETAYERVIRTRTLHCAYGIYPPILAKDPNTGKLSGLSYDIIEELARVSDLKVEWGPEIDWGNIGSTLQTGKADVFCSGMFMTPKRGLVMAGTVPFMFSSLELYARPDDKRFDDNTDRLNQNDVRFSVNLGDLSEEVAQRVFPQAERVYKGEMGGESALFLNVATKKADVTVSAPSNMSTYNQNNPSMALRQIHFKHPLLFFPGVYGVAIHESELLHLLNASLQNLIDNGVVDRFMRADLGGDYNTNYFPPKPQMNP